MLKALKIILGSEKTRRVITALLSQLDSNWRSNDLGLPLLHYTRGICPETGRRIVAKGIIAVGRVAAGGIAIGQASVGIIAIGQLAMGLMFGFGQACTGALALGQLAIGGILGIGQLASGFISVGQFGLGKYVLAQAGFGKYVWSQNLADPETVAFFRNLTDGILSR
ncbi:MAG: hypothetical protein B6245_19400 [Desulfobacteraceae bacterium 4572_88]|nr:MAG: hypothetical protein B6245_19400 [Desulfobacteraceae bacterium 4572_88]